MSTNHHGISRLAAAALGLTLGLTALAASGQTVAMSQQRVPSSVNAAQTVTLHGNVHPLAQPRYDRGPVDDATPTGRMMMVLKRSDAQQAALHQLLAAQQDPHSSSYHKWLTPEQFGAQFGVADADIEAVTTYLAAQGFAVGRVFPNKMAVEFSGTAGLLRSSFGTEMHTYAARGQVFHANATDPKIPAALASVVAGMAPLNNYKTPAPARAQQATLDQSAQTKLNNLKSGATPFYTTVNSGVGVEEISPGDLAVLYDIPGSTTRGANTTVGVVNDSNINLQIPSNYRTTFGLPAALPNVVVDGVDPGINSDDIIGYEQVELIWAVAPGATINYYVSGGDNVDTLVDTGIHFAALRAVLDNAVQVLVFPFEQCEQNLGAVNNSLFTSIWEEAAAQGISVVVPSGSGGAEECSAAPEGTTSSAPATGGLAVNGYASSAFVTAVGASDFYYAGGLPDFAIYWNLNTISNYSFTSALRYVPEQPANLSLTTTNASQQFPPPFRPAPVTVATGGGVSTVGESQLLPGGMTAPSTPHLQPAYQAGVVPAALSTTGTPPVAARVIPDVSMYGGTLGGGLSSYILCVNANDCVNQTSGNAGQPGSLVYTPSSDLSTAAAVFAGVAALVVNSKGLQGNLNPGLYATYKATPSAFHDISNGTNRVACTAGSPNCSGGYSSGYAAAAGYDAASGLGSVDVNNLITAWKTPSATASVALSVTPATAAHGAPVQLTVTVTGTSGVPTGDIAILSTSPQPSSHGIELLPLSGGTVSGNTVTVTDTFNTFLPGGSYNLLARYSGDNTFAPATSNSVPVNISKVASAVSVLNQSFTASGTVPYGTPLSFNLTVVNPTNGADNGTPTGSITINDSNQQSTILPLSSFGTATFQSSILDAGLHTFTATYSGDNSYAGSSISGGSLIVNVAAAPTTTTLTSTDTNLDASNASSTLVATVTPQTAGLVGRRPRGTVQFTRSDGSVLATSTLTLGAIAGGQPAAMAIYTTRNNDFKSNDSVTATFVPDTSTLGDYSGSSSAPLPITLVNTHGLKSVSSALTTTPAGATSFVNTSTLSFTDTLSAPGNGSITGTVTFYANGVALGSAQPVSNSAVTFTIPVQNGVLALPLGISDIVAQYSGDANNAASAGTYQVNVYGRGTTPDFTMSATQNYGVLSATSTSAAFRLSLAALDGFQSAKAPVALTIATPTGITCTASPTSVVFNGVTYTNANVSCSLATGTTIGSLAAPRQPFMWTAAGGAALACLFLFGMPARRRSWQATVGTLSLLVVAFGITGCGVKFPYPNPSSSSSKSAFLGTTGANGTLARGTYTVVVTGTAAVFNPTQPNTTVNVVHTLPLSIVVQ